MSLSHACLLKFSCFEMWLNCHSWDSNMKIRVAKGKIRIESIALSSGQPLISCERRFYGYNFSREWPYPWPSCVHFINYSIFLFLNTLKHWKCSCLRVTLFLCDLNQYFPCLLSANALNMVCYLVILIVHFGSTEASYSSCHWFWYYLIIICLDEFQRLWHMTNDELLHGVVLLFAILFLIISEDTDCFFL